MILIQKLVQLIAHQIVGNYNLGEIGSIFNLGTACTYITPSSSFKIKENFEGFPELVYVSETNIQEILSKYLLSRP